MTETRDAVLQATLDARLREESREAADACAGASPWFAEVLAKVWTIF